MSDEATRGLHASSPTASAVALSRAADAASLCRREKRANPRVLWSQLGPYQANKYDVANVGGEAVDGSILRRISGEPARYPEGSSAQKTRQVEVSDATWLRLQVFGDAGRPDARVDVASDRSGGLRDQRGECRELGGDLRAATGDARGPGEGSDSDLPGAVALARCSALPERLATYQPRSVQACQRGEWSRLLVNRKLGAWDFVTFRCNTWRCTRCAPQANAREAWRIERALGRCRLEDVLFLTLTFDRPAGATALSRWKAAQACWKRFRDALVYELGAGLGRATKKARLTYVQVWEQHEDGWPHLHALIVSRELARAVREHGSHPMPHPRTGEPRPIWHYVRNKLRAMARGAGFGPVADLQFVDPGKGRMAGYLVKIADELSDSLEKDQRPLRAPFRFRRIRATPGFLERLRKASETFTGAVTQFDERRAPLLLELGCISLSRELRELMFKAKPEVLTWQKPSNAPNARHFSIPEGSEVTSQPLMGSLCLSGA